jgi:hypothetical protein
MADFRKRVEPSGSRNEYEIPSGKSGDQQSDRGGSDHLVSLTTN